MPATVLIVAGGTSPSPHVRRALPPATLCLAADSGLDHAYDLGLRPDVVVGDLDSVSAAALARARVEGVAIERHPPRKARTDLELALDLALDRRPERIVVIGAGGGRLDHHLANLLLLADDRYGALRVEALDGTARLTVVRAEPLVLSGAPGEPVSLLPVHGDATGVTTTGLGYPLVGGTLRAGSSLGVSNYFEAATATVVVATGVVLAVQPFGLGGSEQGTPEPAATASGGTTPGGAGSAEVAMDVSEPGGPDGGAAEA